MSDYPIIFSAPMIVALLDGRKTMTRRLLYTKRKERGGVIPASATMLSDHPPPRSPLGPGGFPTDIAVDEYYTLSPWQRVKPGDRLWVRENHQFRGADYGDSGGDIEWFRVYGGGGAADNWDPDFPESWEPSFHMAFRKLTDPDESEGADVIGYVTKLLPSIHMPRWASRLTLVVTATKIERLQEIKEAECVAEGCEVIRLAGNPVDDGPMVRLSPSHVYGTPRTWFRELWCSLHGADAWDANSEVVALTFTVHKTNIDAMPKAEAP